MKVFCHNFNPSSNSGPNKFSRQLFSKLIVNKKLEVINNQQDADLEFALISMSCEKRKPMILRLDGIYFNSDQNYQEQNSPIRYAYEKSDCVIFQSNFNKQLTERWFGTHKKSYVIHNAACSETISKADPSIFDKILDKNLEVWSCASSWRPHKRLEDNLRYFCEFSNPSTVMIVAGKNADIALVNKYSKFSNGRIMYVGELDYFSLISLYKRSSKFIHLAYLDHCPNVVVDAQAAGCEIVCSSTGGTSEVVKKGRIVKESEWDFSPIQLYKPPEMNFENFYDINTDDFLTLDEVSIMYYKAMKDLTK